MKKRNIVIISTLVLFFSCTTNSNKSADKMEFKDLAKEEAFAEKHDLAKAENKVKRGKRITLDIEGDKPTSIYSIEKKGSANYLFVVHEWWGLNDHIMRVSDELYDSLANVNVIALDLYDGKIATTPEKAGEYMQSAEESRLNRIIKSVLATLPADAKIGTIGWCFGGGWSLNTALLAADKTNACVVFYGMPTEDKTLLKTLNTDVLFIYGNQDQWITPKVAERFQQNMLAANKKTILKGFDADHAFANPSSEKYDKGAAKEANEIALKYLRQRLK